MRLTLGLEASRRHRSRPSEWQKCCPWKGRCLLRIVLIIVSRMRLGDALLVFSLSFHTQRLKSTFMWQVQFKQPRIKASNCLTAVCCALSLPQAMSSAMRESSRSKSLSSPILIGNLRMMAWIAASRPPAPDAACGWCCSTLSTYDSQTDYIHRYTVMSEKNAPELT